MKSKLKSALIFTLLLLIAWGCIFLKFISTIGFSDGIAFAYSFIYAFGHSFEFAFVCLLSFLIFALLPGKLQMILSVGVALLITCFLVVDYIVYAQFRLHIDGGILSMFFGEGAGDIFVFPLSTYLQAFGGFVILLVFVVILWRLAKFVSKHLKKTLVLAYICLFCTLLGYHAISAWAFFKSYHPIVSQVPALPLSYPLTVNSYMRKHGYAVPDSVPNIASKLISYPLSPIELAEHKNLNVVVILIDSWRFDVATEEVTPNIMEFSKQAIRFKNHNATSNHTKHGVFTFFYGIPGAYWVNILADRISPVLMDTFLQENYEMGIYGSANLVSPEFNRTVFAKVENMQTSTPGASAVERDIKITENFIEFIQNQDQERPFFSFLFYDSPHAMRFDETIYPPKFIPYDDKNYISNNADDAYKYFNNYKNSVGFVDVLVKRALDTLQNEGLLENTIVIIAGDHGEEFNDLGDGFWGHNGNYSKYQTAVPLFVYWPGMEAGDITYATSHMDIAPTLMQTLFNTTTPAEAYTIGTNLFETERNFIFMHGAGDSYAITKDGIITVFPVFGAVHAFDEDTYEPLDVSFSMDMWREIMQILTRFRK